MPYLRPRPITVRELEALAKETGRHSIGDGLILNVAPSGRAKSWTCRLRVPSGERRDLGLGAYPEVTLAEARERAAQYRRMVRDGLDPIEEKRKARQRAFTFRMAAEQCWEERKGAFKNGKHVDQWINTLRAYAYPTLGDISIADVHHSDVKAALQPIWLEKKETARRTLQRICDVARWAVGEGLRDAELPRDVIRSALGRQKKKVRHFPAVPIEEAPRVYGELKKKGTRAAEALRFQILTALRPGIGRAARWDEMDLENGLWSIPAERMKTDEPHVVPLPEGAIDILKIVKAIPLPDEEGADFVFPSPMKPTKSAISDTSLKNVQSQSIKGFTLHGWRSTFEDWAAEHTNFEAAVIDAAMAHALENEVKAAYQRTLFLDQRLDLMQQWDDFLEGRTKVRHGLDAAYRARMRAAAGVQQASPE